MRTGPEDGFLAASRWSAGGDLAIATKRLIAPACLIAALAVALWSTWFYVVIEPESLGMDARAYFVAGHQDQPYDLAPGEPFAVLYSPVFVQLMRLMALMPWSVFLALWMVANVVSCWWLAAPLPRMWRITVMALCVPTVLIGNIYGVLAVCFVIAVIGRPSSAVASATIVLTKVSPAVVIAEWYLLGRDWRRLAVAAATIGVAVGCSVAVEPGLWGDWLGFLVDHSQGGDLRPAPLLAGLLLVVLVRHGAPLWLLGLAFYLTSPMASWVAQELVPLMTIPRLLAYERLRAEPAPDPELDVGPHPHDVDTDQPALTS